MDRNAILQSLIDSFVSYSATDARKSVTKVLKYSGGSFDIRKRGDIVSESVFFRPTNATVPYYINDEKPSEVQQTFEVLVFVDQPDSHSFREAAYDRILEVTDIVLDWLSDTSAETISSDVYTLKFTSLSNIDETQGYLSTTVTFQSIIKIQ